MYVASPKQVPQKGPYNALYIGVPRIESLQWGLESLEKGVFLMPVDKP